MNVLVKLNPLLIDYPLTMDVWEKKLMKKDFDKLNIIRWIELRPNFMFQKYSATAIDDGKFKIRLDVKYKCFIILIMLGKRFQICIE